jgi:hypothetical protein
MHRSGTSMVARLLNVLGVDLGPADTLRQPDQFNPTGFWEQQQFIDFNDEILKRLGGTWRKLPRRPAGWERGTEFDELFDQARRFVTETFAGIPCWGWKDPRTCVTLPFWQRLLPDLTYIVCVRNPVDVAHSLEHTMSFKKAGRLWLSYVTSSLIHTAGRERLCVFYEDCLNQQDEQLQRLAEFLGLSGQVDDAKSQARVTGFVDSKREHHRTSPPGVIQEPRLGFASKALYSVLRLSVPGADSGTAAPALCREMIDSLTYRALESHYRLLAKQGKIAQQTVQIQNAERIAAQRESDMARRQAAFEQQLANERTAREKLSADHQRADAQRRAEIAVIKTELEKREKALRRVRRRLRTTVQKEHRDLQERLVSLAERLGSRRRGRRPRKSRPAPENGLLDYSNVVERIQLLAKKKLPACAKALVVSKGDDDLLRLGSVIGRHFPYDAAGDYSGFHPHDSEAAIAALEAARSDGAEFLVLPQTAIWWLEHYGDFKKHLERRYRLHVEERLVCVIYDLRSRRPALPRSAAVATAHQRNKFSRPSSTIQEPAGNLGLTDQIAEVVHALLPDRAAILVVSDGDDELTRRCGGRHFPQDVEGAYACERVVDGAAMIAQLETLAAGGAQYLVIPRTRFDWLEQDTLFTGHLRAHHRQITFQPHVCSIFALQVSKGRSPQRTGRARRASK